MVTGSPKRETILEMPADGSVPGVVVHFHPAHTRTYVSSPSLAILPDGTYVASLDHFGPGCYRNETFVHASSDRGQTWQQIAYMTGQWWSTLFEHNGALYLMGTTTEYGNCVIRRSTDGGHTWTTPDSPATGLLGQRRYHCNVVPVLKAKGRLWRGMEDAEAWGNWGEMFRAFVMHADENADLLNAESWTQTPPIERNREWLDGDFGGWLEGNAVLTPEGKIINFLRVASLKRGSEKAAIMHISEDGTDATFDPDKDIIDFAGGSKKFVIRFDESTGRYIALVNDVPNPNPEGRGLAARNTLSLVSSADLKDWTRHGTLLHNPDDQLHGYQYVDWQFDGDDLIFLSRTAHGVGDQAAHNHHDSNYITFHRIPDFRNLLQQEEQ